jgi:hypothetical protein
VRNERLDRDPALDRRLQRLFNFLQIETEDGDPDTLLGAGDGLDERLHAVARLNDELHEQ